MVVATGTSNRHVSALAENVLKDLREKGIKGIEPEGKDMSEWVLLDVTDVIVHIFQPEVREKYDIEKMWQIPTEGKDAAKKDKKKAEKSKAKKDAKKAAKKANGPKAKVSKAKAQTGKPKAARKVTAAKAKPKAKTATKKTTTKKKTEKK